MKEITATNARSALFNLIASSVKTHRPYKITSRAGAAVLLSEEDFDNLLETLELLSTPGLLKSVRKAKKEIGKGQTYSFEEVFGA